LSEENVEIVRRLYTAVVQRDSATVYSLYHPEFEFDGSRSRWAEMLPGDLAIFRGHHTLHKWSQAYYGEWENLQDDIEELIDAGDQVVSVVTTRARGRASGIEVEWKENAGLWTLRDGKIVRIEWFPSRAEALEAAGISE
jgi:ketosteroid isomerase-like protein